jgi:hypothetical protein
MPDTHTYTLRLELVAVAEDGIAERVCDRISSGRVNPVVDQAHYEALLALFEQLTPKIDYA